MAYLQHDRNFTRGTWKKTWRRAYPLSADVCCPRCGWVASLADHIIAPNGAVSPSVACPNPRCDWHDWIILAGWQEEDTTV